MDKLVLIETIKKGTQVRLSLSALQTFVVNPNSSYQIIDEDTQQPPKNMRLKRDDNELHVEVDGERVVNIEDFFVGTNNAFFSVDDGANSQLISSSSEMLTANDGVIWEASNEVASSSGADSGYGSTLLYGGAGLGALAVVRHHNLSDSTPASYDISFTAAAGELQSTVTVIVYDSSGNVLTSEDHNFSTGPFVLSIEDAYVGPILVKVVDINGTDGDYIDEATNQLTSLGGDLRAMAFADGTNDVAVNITPLTELAVRQAGITDNNQVTEENLSVNDAIGELLGVDNIIGSAIPITDAAYDGSDGLSNAETYGNVLAVLSGLDSASGNIDASLALLIDNIVSDNGQLTFNQVAIDALTAGADTFESGANGGLADLSATLSVIDSVAPTVTRFSSNAGNGTYGLGDSIEFTATLSEGVQAEDSIVVTLESGETITLIAPIDGATLTGAYTVNVNTSADGLLVSSYSIVSLTDNVGNTTTSTALPETNIDIDGIVIDVKAPTLASSTPSDDVGDVALDADIVLTFDENITLGTGNIVISDGNETITIDVENHAGQLLINNNVLTINLSSDLANSGANYNVQVAETAITDIAGNAYVGIADTTSLDFQTERDTSIVVFDLTIGESSSHSSRTFDADVSYTIFIVVNTASVEVQQPELWASANNLGADDNIVLVGTNADNYPVGYFGNPITLPIVTASFVFWTSGSLPGAALAVGGSLIRFAEFQTSVVDLWDGAIGTFPQVNLGFLLPSGVLTSQGMA